MVLTVDYYYCRSETQLDQEGPLGVDRSPQMQQVSLPYLGRERCLRDGPAIGESLLQLP